MADEAGLIVSVSGIRGIVGKSLTPEAATAFACALGTSVDGGRIVLSRDGRPSGIMLRHAVLAGLLSAGCEVQDLGIASTPTFGLAITQLKAAGGIQITASHNPAPWNGLKLFGKQGGVLSAEDGQKIRTLFDAKDFRREGWDKLGIVHDCSQAQDWHLERVLELIDVPRIKSHPVRPLLDANGGAGGPLGLGLLESLQCRPICRACDADGVFLHEPEPIAENLQSICPMVAEKGADVGFVLDPDADRLALIDETGRYIGEELTLALAVSFRLRHDRGPVVVNMSTSRVCEDIAKKHGCAFHRSPVGEAHVVAMMREVGAVIGGEGNGGVIDPRVGWVRDPFIGMGLILNLLAESGKKLSALVAELPAYVIVKDKYQVDAKRLPRLFFALTTRWPDAARNEADGLRLDWNDSWVHVRPSNTEPIVRVIAEAPQEGRARELCKMVGEMLQQEAS